MKMKEALEVVIDLAQQNVVDDFEMPDEAERQQTAINLVEKFKELLDQSAD